MSPEDTALCQSAIDTANRGDKLSAYQQFCTIYTHPGNAEDVTLLYWLAFTTPNMEECERAIATITRLAPDHPKLAELHGFLERKRAQYQQPPYHLYQPPMYPQPGPYMHSPLYPPLYAPPMMMQSFVNVNVQRSGPGFFIRALYFFFVGWWLGLIWLNIGFALCALIITIPLGLVMLNNLPQVMTLKSASTQASVNVSSSMQMGAYGQPMMQQHVNVNIGGVQQYSMLVRAIYFLFVGWWAGYLWACLAYCCIGTLILLPVGVMMFDRLPMVLTLRKN